MPVVIDPELEAWVFSDSPHVDKVLGWTNRNPTLREALEQQKLWGPKDSKPADPKAALEWVLKTAGRRPISSAYFRNLARRVSTKRCQDRAFLRFRKLLQDWFPPDSSFNSNPGFDHPSGDGTNIVGHKVKTGKKLIEVALPLDAINAASVREKSIRHGHPSTLHLWWARRPLAAARAVIFSQMVDDPSAHPDRFPTEKAQARERERLFGLIEKLVKWENTNDAKVLAQAREEIRESWLRTCIDNADHPRAATLFDPDRLPAFHDPFAGGGALPLEAQRLGLEAHASDLNPVAVLINKAMIEIPPRFAGRPPVNPDAQAEFARGARWNGKGAQGLAEDVRYYGRWMRDEAEKRIGHLYPKIEVTEAMAAERPDLKGYVGRKLTVIAWLWARTVKSPNPAFAQVDVPLASTFMLSTKKGKGAWVEPVIEGGGYRFTVKTGAPEAGVPEAGASEAGIPEAGVPGTGVPETEADIPKDGASGNAGVPPAQRKCGRNARAPGRRYAAGRKRIWRASLRRSGCSGNTGRQLSGTQCRRDARALGRRYAAGRKWIWRASLRRSGGSVSGVRAQQASRSWEQLVCMGTGRSVSPTSLRPPSDPNGLGLRRRQSHRPQLGSMGSVRERDRQCVRQELRAREW